MITKIRKRDGREVPFNIERITNAIFKAAVAAGGSDYHTAESLAEQVAETLEHSRKKIPSVEEIQDPYPGKEYAADEDIRRPDLSGFQGQ